METLDSRYFDHLEAIKNAIQDSEILAAYLEEEEEEYYKQLQEYFEPAMQEVFDEVANSNPLQLEALEKEYLDPAYEGLFLPKILGYSVLRGEVDDNFKYRRPQDHFKEILEAICNSANFEMIKKRIGQTVQLGFALSSDIWITNLINGQNNKRIKTFLNSLKVRSLREVQNREILYKRYKKQLNKVNFASTQFPANEIELKSSYHALRTFLNYRANHNVDNSELMGQVSSFLNNEVLYSSEYFFKLHLIIGLSYDLDTDTAKKYSEIFAAFIKNNENLEESFFEEYERLHEDEDVVMTPEKEQRISKLLSGIGSQEIDKFFSVVNEVHSKGFIHVEAIDSVSSYYEKHQGMSLQNECLRASILSYVKKFISNLDPENYADYMEINKIIIAYIGIFNNEKFNQEVKDVSLDFVKRFMLRYTDKKSRDYQDLKKYISATFKDLGFLTDKEVVNLFKTKRKSPAKK